MFDDTKALDDLVRNLFLVALAVLIINPIVVFFATRWLQRLVRRRGRRGNWLAALSVVLAVELAVVVVAVMFADGPSWAAALWLALAVGVLALALMRLVAPAAPSGQT